MLLKVGSILLVLLLTGYYIYHFYLNIEKYKGLINKITPFLFGISAAALGFSFILTSNYNLFFTVVIGLLFAISSGFTVKKIFQIEKWMNQSLSSLLGYLVGAFIGYMTFISTKPFLIVDVLYIVIIYLMLMYSDKKAAETFQKKSTKKKGKQKPTSNAPSILLAATLLIFVVALSINVKSIKAGIIGQPQNQTATQDEQNDLQNASIHVTPSGFNPKNTTLKAKTMLKVIFDVDQQVGNNVKLISTDLNLSVNLKKGENVVLLDNPLKGQYQIKIEPGNFTGTLTVK
jgi:hypothetical protein